MRRSVVETNPQSTVPEKNALAGLSERWLRQAGAWLILYLLLQAELGLAWDRNWHDLVGRDQFWIPPHIMMYSGLGGVGVVALTLILVNSVRYWRGKVGVDDSSTAHLFWLFHAPLGYIMVGFGACIDLLAAPFDNYWHQLYGIDVTLWSPFHLMGTFGGVLAGIGSVYIFASEASIERQAERPGQRFLGLYSSEWGLLILLASFIELSLPSSTAFTPVTLGPVQILLYPLILILVNCSTLCSAVQTIRRPRIASLTVAILWVEALLTQLFVPWALNFAVPRFGYTFRFSGRIPHFNLVLVLLPPIFLLSAMLLDAAVCWQRRKSGLWHSSERKVALLGMAMAVPILILPQLVVQALLQGANTPLIPPDIIRVLGPDWWDTLVTLPFALILGALVAMLGTSLGDIWYLSRR